ncbi:B12-binding domain-containing radical SAM protein [Gemmatimonadota bacterium]
MNILLVDPALRDGVPELYENIGIAALAASTRQAGFETGTILTHLEGWSYRRLGQEIIRRDPDVLGVSLLSYNARRTLNLLRRLKQDGLRSRIVVGGHFPTFNDEILLQKWPELDVVVRGEGDLILVDLLKNWEAEDDPGMVEGVSFREGSDIRRNPARPLQKDLDSLPWPVRDHTERIIEMGGSLNLVRARGCYANCAFCSIASFYRSQGGPGWRQRSVGSVIEEMRELTARFPDVEVKFHDDQFIGPGMKGWEDAMAFAQALIDEGSGVPFSIFARADSIEPELFRALKAAGLKSVFVGIESGSQNQLDSCGKRTSVAVNRQSLEILNELEISFVMGLIFFDPYTRMADVSANLSFLMDTQSLWGPRGNVLSIENRVIVYKGTPFHERLAAEGRLEGDYIDCTYTIRDWRVRYLSKLSHLVLKRVLPGMSVIKRLPAHLRLFRKGVNNRFRILFHRRSRSAPIVWSDLNNREVPIQSSTFSIEKGVHS